MQQVFALIFSEAQQLTVPFTCFIFFQEMEASENPSLQTGGPDPMLFCTASKKNRFYIFSTRQPDLRYVFSVLYVGRG